MAAPGVHPGPHPGLVVAVDGSSGSGKSTLCRAVASALGAAYLDTGATYRAVCWACLEDGTDLADAEAVARTAVELDLQLGTDPAAPSVRVRGRDVTAALRDSRISTAVSAVATNLAVRAELVARQRAVIAEAAAERGVVAEGRDTTTVVAPDAAVRVLLVTDEAARLSRRAREVHGRDDAEAVAATRDQVVRRDRDDSTVAAFTTAAEGVEVVDNSGELADAVAAVLALVERVERAERPTAAAAASTAGARP